MLLVLVLTLVASSFAADVTARIRGTIFDPAGAVVPNVTVTATNVATGIDYTAVSNATGNYAFLQLPVGKYVVTTSPAGFRKYTASDITLNIDMQFVQDIHLQVGQASETVEVTANPAQVDTTNIQHNAVVNTTQIVEMPLIGRNFTQLEQVFPGVQASSDRFGTYSANGAQTQQSSFLVNGIDINDAPLNTAVVIPSPDAVQEFNMVSSSLSAEYSRNSGAVVSVGIKNGTNSFHGDAFDFYRDTFLNTANYFQNKKRGGAGAPKYHQNLFGGTIGGPVWKDKAFFFLSYQGNRAIQPISGGTVSVYSPAQRGGDFTLNSATGKANVFSDNPIPDTITVPGCAAGSTWAQCATVLGNKFPTSAFNPVAAKLMNEFVPGPTQGTTYSFSPTQQAKQDQWIQRYDFSPNQSNQFWFIGIIEHRPTTVELPFTGANLPGFTEVDQRATHQFTFDYTHTFSATLLNDFRVGMMRFNYGAVYPQKAIDPKSYGFNITPQVPQFEQIPVIAVSGLFTLGFSTNGPQPRLDQNYQITDNLTKIVGNHILKFGFDARRFAVDNPFYNSLSGSYTFQTSSNPNTSGDAGLDFLMGVPYSYGQGTGAQINARAYETYAYAQDQWKVQPNLTLTLGAGWQMDTPWRNLQYNSIGVTCFVNGQQSKIFPTAPKGLNYPGDPGCDNAHGAKNSWKNIGPRVGFAWAPTLGFLSGGESHKMSIRGGYGIYFNRTEEEGALQNLGDPPYGINSGGATDYGPNYGYPQFANPWADINTGQAFPNKFPASQYTPSSPNIPWENYEPFVLSEYNKSYTMPYAMNFNLTVERELPAQVVASLAYVGSLARHQQITIEGNPITQAGHDACLASTTCQSRRTYQGLYYPSHTLYGNSDLFSSIGLISSIGNSSYNSLQAGIKKGFTHGLMFQMSFTWAHALDNGSSLEGSGWGGASRGYNPIVPGLNWGDSQYDARYRYVFAPVYHVPNWKSAPGMHWLPDVIGRGWELSGIMTLATGFPFDVRMGGYNSLWCWGYQYYACSEVPNTTGQLKTVNPRNPGIGTTGQVFWFDPNVGFSNEPIGSFGNTHRNPFHGPGINNADVMLAKNIYFVPGHENFYAQLRLESYNVFNHTQFALPAGTVSFASNGTVNNSFGRITSAAAGRQTQLALKIYF